MATTKQEIRTWLLRAKQEGATHVIIVCDTYDHEDYPKSVKEGEDVYEVKKKYDGVNMQRVMEVYNLSMDIDAQLNQGRAFNY